MSITANIPIEEDYLISTDPDRLDIPLIHQYLAEQSYWAKNIPFDVVKRSLANSFCFGIYHHNQQVGLARLITDKTTFAYLCDVFILEAHRGKGLSKWLLATIHAHPDMQGLRRWMLGTMDAHGLYAQFGWTALPEEAVPRFMQLHYPDVYTSNHG